MKVTYVGNAAKKERGIDVTYTGGSAQKTGRVKATYVGGAQSKAVYDAEVKDKEALTERRKQQKNENQSVFSRAGKTVTGGLKGSIAGNMDAMGVAYQAGQGGRTQRNTAALKDAQWAVARAKYAYDTDKTPASAAELDNALKQMKAYATVLGDGAYDQALKAAYDASGRIGTADLNKLYESLGKVNVDTSTGAQQKATKASRDLALQVQQSGSRDIEAAKEGVGTFGQMVIDAGASMAQMGGDLVANALLGTPGSMMPFATRAFGGATMQAREGGGDLKQQIAYGAVQAGKEVLTEKMFNMALPFAKAYGGGALDDVTQRAIQTAVDKLGKTVAGKRALNAALQLTASGVGEGLEELIGDWMEWQMPRIYGGDVDTAGETLANSLYDFVVGGMAGVSGSVISPDTYSYGRYAADVRQNTAPEMDSKAAQAVDAVTRGESITGNQAAAIAKNPVAVETLEANTGVKLNTQQPISQLKRDIAALASRDTTQAQSQGTTATPATQRRAQKPTGGFLEAGQKAYQEMRRTAEDVPTLYAGFSSVYNAGLNGIEASKAKGAYAAMLTPEQRYAAYNAGLEDAAAQVARENAEVKSVTTTAGAGLADNVYSRAVIAKSKRTAATLNAMGKKLGVRIEFVDSVMGGQANGQYIRDKNLIQIAVDSNKPYLNVAAHEVTHRMQDLSPAEYRKFRQAAMEHRMREKGIDEMAEVVEWYREKAESAGVTLTQDEVMDEIAADFAGDMMENPDLFREFSRSNRTAAQKLLDSLKEFIAKVKSIFTGKSRDVAAQEAYGKDFAELEAVAQKWQEAFDAAERQAERAKAAAGEGDGAKYQIKQFPNGMKYVQADRQVLFGNDPMAWSEQLENYINGKIRNNEDVRLIAEDGDILILTRTSAGKLSSRYNNYGQTMSDETFERKANAASHIDELIKVSVRGGETVLDEAGRHGDMAKDGWNYRTAYFMDFDGKYYRTRISVALGKDGSIVYNIGKMQERSIPRIAGSSGNSGALLGNASVNSIPTDGENVKPKFSLKAPVEETKNLLALHNLTEKNLLDAAKLGGLPMPSIAIVKADEGHGEYGDISFVFSKDTIDPQLFRSNKVYGYDAWTPTAPRIEYEVNEKYAKKIHDLFYRMERSKGRSFADPLYSAANTLEDELNRKGGVDKVVGAMRDDPRVMNIYLEDTGRGAVENVMKREVTRMDDNQQEMASFLIRELGESTVNDFRAKGGEPPIAARKLWYKEHGEALNAALQKYYEKLGLPAKDAADVVNAETVAAKMRYMLDTRKYLAGNTETVTEEVDRAATNKAIRDKVNQKEYEQWLDDLFDGVVKNEGIYNGKDYYTSSGNRRSFSATHYEITLENIVKAMKQGDQKGADTFFGGQAIWGVASKDYGSIDEIKADSGRLQKMTEEEYSAIRQKYSERLAELTNEIKDPAARNEFIASDDAASAIVETLRTKRTVAGIDKELRTYPTLQIKPDTAEKVLQLYKDISNMPTGYFEAKPQRAVGFDEVLAAVIPNDASAEVRAALENAGVRMIEYTSGDEKARLDAVNSVEGARFQLRETQRLPDELEDLRDTYIRRYGEIPEGENATRQVRLPRKTSDKEKVSQTVRTILEANATPDEIVPTIEELALRGEYFYEAYSDKQAISDAETKIKDVGWAQALTSWTDKVRGGNVSKENTAMGWALYNNAANSGDTATALTILNNMVEHQRSAAQALQATRILKKLSPETQLYQIQRSVKNLQEEINKRYGDKKSPKLKIDRELAERFLRAKDQTERDNVLTDIYRDIGRQLPSRFIDKWNAWRYLAMLGNARTHIRNIVGNAGFAPVVAVKNAIATGIEAGVNKVSGGKLNRSKAFVSGKGGKSLFSAAAADFDKIQDVAMGGGKYSEFANANKAIEEGRVIFRSKIPGLKQVSKGLEKARRFNSAALETEDMWFSKPHYAYAMAQYCKANGITAEMIAEGKGIEKARKYAIKEAQKATYRDTNAFSQFVSEIGRRRGSKTGVEKIATGIIEGILPFRKTPANILMRGVEYSPLGLANGIKQALWDVRTGKKTGAEAIDSISAGLTGTGLLGLGVYLASQALLRGHGGDDDDKREFEDLQGHQTYSLELPDGTSITLDWLAPECLPLFIGVNLWEETNGGKESLTLSELLTAISNVSEPLLEMSCLQSLNAIFDVVGYAKSDGIAALPKAVASAATSYLTQAFPTLLGQAERTGEGKRYTTYTNKNNKYLTPDMQYAVGKASARIPGWDYNQIPYIDAWGRTELTGKTGERAFNNFLNPAYTSKVDESPMEKELMRLYNATGETVFPSRASKNLTVNGEAVTLGADDYVKYAQQKGQGAYKRLTALTRDSEYKKLTNEEKVQCVKDFYTLTDQIAKSNVSKYEPESWVTKALAGEKKGISATDYVIARAKTSDVESLKDKNGETIANSKGLLVMEQIYSIDGLTSDQRQYLFSAMGVGKKIIHYNKALVQQELRKMRNQ
jgi:hypothetical protein